MSWILVLAAPLWSLSQREAAVVLQIFFWWSCHSTVSRSKLADWACIHVRSDIKATETRSPRRNDHPRRWRFFHRVFGSGVSGSLIDGHWEGKCDVPKPISCAVGHPRGWQISTHYLIQTFHLMIMMAAMMKRANNILLDYTSHTSTTMRINCWHRRRNSWSSWKQIWRQVKENSFFPTQNQLFHSILPFDGLIRPEHCQNGYVELILENQLINLIAIGKRLTQISWTKLLNNHYNSSIKYMQPNLTTSISHHLAHHIIFLLFRPQSTPSSISFVRLHPKPQTPTEFCIGQNKTRVSGK